MQDVNHTRAPTPCDRIPGMWEVGVIAELLGASFCKDLHIVLLPKCRHPVGHALMQAGQPFANAIRAQRALNTRLVLGFIFGMSKGLR